MLQLEQTISGEDMHPLIMPIWIGIDIRISISRFFSSILDIKDIRLSAIAC